MVEKRIIWEKEEAKVGEFVFDTGKTKKFTELNRQTVLVVPIDQNKVYLLWENRPFLGKSVWRVPAGTVEANEGPKITAARELEEEAGLKAGKLELIGENEFMEWVKFPMKIYLATELDKKAEQKLEDYEKIEVKTVSLKEAKEIALEKMIEPHQAYALLKALHTYKKG